MEEENKRGKGRPRKTEENKHIVLPPKTKQLKKFNRLPDPQTLITNQGLVRSKLSRKEQEVIKNFLESGNRIESFKKVFSDYTGTDRSIYRWYQRSYISAEMFSISKSLAIYDTYIDNQIIKMITDPNTQQKNKIELIKIWNELKKRIDNTVKVDHTINFQNITDATLSNVFDKIFNAEKMNELEIEEVDYIEEEEDENEEGEEGEDKSDDEDPF